MYRYTFSQLVLIALFMPQRLGGVYEDEDALMRQQLLYIELFMLNHLLLNWNEVVYVKLESNIIKAGLSNMANKVAFWTKIK